MSHAAPARGRFPCLLLLAAACTPTPGADATAGGKDFATECAECHSVKEGKDKKGPSLFAIVGSKAARREGFAYSEAMTSSGLTWTPDALSSYIAAPRKVVPAGKMKYDGLVDAREREDLVTYLATVH